MVDALAVVWESELRAYLAPLIALPGFVFAFRGAHRVVEALRLPSHAMGKNLRLMTGFRLVICGTASVALAAGWFWQIEVLAVAAAIVGLGELFETSIDAWALRREIREG